MDVRARRFLVLRVLTVMAVMAIAIALDAWWQGALVACGGVGVMTVLDHVEKRKDWL